MADSPLMKVPGALPAVRRLNQLRREVEGRVRSIDMLRWKDVPYGPHPRHRMLVWELDDLAPRDGWPAVLLFHGGGWAEGQKEDFVSLAPQLSRLGFWVAAVDYRLAPEHRWPAQQEDVALALQFVHGQQIDPRRVAVWGHSAGGQMAVLAALTQPSPVRCAVALGAPMDLRETQHLDHVFGRVFDRSQLAEASPITHVRAGGPPILLVHGAQDRVAPIEDARRFAVEAPDVTLYEVPGGDHALRWPPRECLRARKFAREWLLARIDPPPRGSKWRIRRKKKRTAS